MKKSWPAVALALQCLLLFYASFLSAAEPYRDITVAADGSGDFRTISEALNQLPMYTFERVVIFIKKGVYEEKIRIENDNLTLLGEDRDSTIIQYSQLREDWQKNKDHIGPAVVNIHADDVILKNLTVINTQPKVGPHAFAVFGDGTRTILYNCNLLSKGADTVSLWNYKHGLYYHAQCRFEGGVDFVCPRGWCYISDSHFFEVSTSAAVWHAATTEQGQKLVIRNSSFDGAPGFQLGRHHYDAQFFFLNCEFSANMADRPIYRVVYEKEPERNRPYFWGDRYYFDQCRKEGAAFPWLRDNLGTSGVKAAGISAAWTFEGRWDPESTLAPVIQSWEIKGSDLFLYFKESLSIRGAPELTTATGKKLRFEEGRGRDTLRFRSDLPLEKVDFRRPVSLGAGVILATQAAIADRIVPEKFQLSSKF